MPETASMNSNKIFNTLSAIAMIGIGTAFIPSKNPVVHYVSLGIVGGAAGYALADDNLVSPHQYYMRKFEWVYAGGGSAMAIGLWLLKEKKLPTIANYIIAGAIGATVGFVLTDNAFPHKGSMTLNGFGAAIGATAGALLLSLRKNNN